MKIQDKKLFDTLKRALADPHMSDDDLWEILMAHPEGRVPAFAGELDHISHTKTRIIFHDTGVFRSSGFYKNDVVITE